MTPASRAASTEAGLCFPLRIEAIHGKTAFASSLSGSFEIDLSLLEDVRPGDHVICHRSMAISVLDKDDALETIRMLKSLRSF